MRIPIGTRSVLWGVHQFVVHPLILARAWSILYGFPWDPRIWMAFIVHDLGYCGKPNMDGPEGEEHVWFGANMMHTLFDLTYDDEWVPEYMWVSFKIAHEGMSREWQIAPMYDNGDVATSPKGTPLGHVRMRRLTLAKRTRSTKWRDLCLYHSRFWSDKNGMPISRLCVADKLVIAITPVWLWCLLARASGEGEEYMRLARENGKYSNEALTMNSLEEFIRDLQDRMRVWIVENKERAE